LYFKFNFYNLLPSTEALFIWLPYWHINFMSTFVWKNSTSFMEWVIYLLVHLSNTIYNKIFRSFIPIMNNWAKCQLVEFWKCCGLCEWARSINWFFPFHPFVGPSFPFVNVGPFPPTLGFWMFLLACIFWGLPRFNYPNLRSFK
jgi:hypothetical protein